MFEVGDRVRIGGTPCKGVVHEVEHKHYAGCVPFDVIHIYRDDKHGSYLFTPMELQHLDPLREEGPW